MPEMNFQTRDAIALAMLAMSWKDNSEIPRDYIPGIDVQYPYDLWLANKVIEEWGRTPND